MTNPTGPGGLNPLPEDVAQRLLARATELDGRSAGASIPQLRQAAIEAGISPEAFDAALAEMVSTQAAMPVRPRSRTRPWALAAGGVLAAAAAGLILFFAIPNLAPVPVPVIPVPPAPAAPLAPAPTPRPWYDEQMVDRSARPMAGAVAPVYPAMLRAANVEGNVMASFVVDANGAVDIGTFSVLSSTHDLFTNSARSAVASMRFAPAQLGGRAVAQRVVMPFNFSLSK